MKKTRRAIPDNRLTLIFFLFVCIISLVPISIWLWNKVVNVVIEKGPKITQQRIEHVFNRQVRLSGTSLSFPLKLSIDGLSIFQKNNNSLFLKAPQVEIDLSIFSLLTGKLRPKKIKIISPEIAIFRTANGDFSLGDPTSLAKVVAKFFEKPPDNYSSFSLSAWPVIFNPGTIEVTDGQIHLEDELDNLPQLDGNFKLLLRRSPDRNQLSLKSARLTLNQTPFFYRGLQGTASGTISFTAYDITVNMDVVLSGGGSLNVVGRISDYRKTSRSSFELKAKSFDLRTLALTKLPLIALTRDATLSANFEVSNPILYGRKLDSFSATVLYNKGQWRIDAIDMKLADNGGEISGSIVPEINSEADLATATLLYQGNTAPPLQLKDFLINELSPNTWIAPITISSSMIINLSTYPPLITKMKLTSSNGDIFTQGSFDLFSGFTSMEGTYLKSKNSNSYAQKNTDKKGVDAIDITINGSITAPEISSIPMEE